MTSLTFPSAGMSSVSEVVLPLFVGHRPPSDVMTPHVLGPGRCARPCVDAAGSSPSAAPAASPFLRHCLIMRLTAAHSLNLLPWVKQANKQTKKPSDHIFFLYIGV